MARLKIGFIPIEGGTYYKEALEEVTRAEELGFDSVWMEEHHAVTNHAWPQPFPVLAGSATRTSKVMLGTDIAVAAFSHPVRLAEDIAMLDVMSNGRITLGIAIGYKPDEFALYGVDLARRGARFEEQLAIMKGLWTQETVSFKGTYYTVEGRIEPKPVTKPHPPVWIGGWGDITLRRAATVAYRREYAGGWRHPFIDASIATDLDRLMEDRFLIGGPDQVIPKIRKLVDTYSMTHLICRTFFPGMPHAHIMHELDLLAREVMPAFK